VDADCGGVNAMPDKTTHGVETEIDDDNDDIAEDDNRQVARDRRPWEIPRTCSSLSAKTTALKSSQTRETNPGFCVSTEVLMSSEKGTRWPQVRSS